MCKPCRKIYDKERYSELKPYYKAKAKEYQVKYRDEVFPKLKGYLDSHPCVDCGEDDNRVLQFDHIDRDSKIAAISTMMKNKQPWDKILLEIAKCEVRCANCHIRRTAIQFNWWTSKVDKRNG